LILLVFKPGLTYGGTALSLDTERAQEVLSAFRHHLADGGGVRLLLVCWHFKNHFVFYFSFITIFHTLLNWHIQ
jgi:hypothetical protein